MNGIGRDATVRERNIRRWDSVQGWKSCVAPRAQHVALRQKDCGTVRLCFRGRSKGLERLGQ